MIKNIIFDFDGVLVDSEILVAKAFAKYMQKYAIEIDENEFANFAGKKTVQVIDILSGGKLSTVNRTTGMNTVGLISKIGLMNPFNRKQESEADHLGMIFSSLSGYDIRETVKIWERMKEFNKGKAQPEFLSTHPSAENRIKKINEWTNEIILEYPPINIS